MRLFILCISMLWTAAVSAQTFGVIYTDGTWTEKQVERHMDRQIAKGKENGSVSFASKEKRGDTLIYVIREEAASFTVKATFNSPGKEPGVKYCDFEKYSFDCSCSKKYLVETLKSSGFRKNGDDKYLSSFAYKTQLAVDYKNESRDCIDMTFTYVDLIKKAYNEIYEHLDSPSVALNAEGH